MMLEVLRYALIVVLAVIVWRQLRSGRAKGDDEVITRGDSPRTYWAIVLSEVVAILVLLFAEMED